MQLAARSTGLTGARSPHSFSFPIAGAAPAQARPSRSILSMLPHLRPMNVGEILDGAFRLYRTTGVRAAAERLAVASA